MVKTVDISITEDLEDYELESLKWQLARIEGFNFNLTTKYGTKIQVKSSTYVLSTYPPPPPPTKSEAL